MKDNCPQTLEEICSHVVTRCNELLPNSRNSKYQDSYEYLKIKLARKEKNWLATQNLFRWVLNDPSLAERMNYNLDNTFVTINNNNYQEVWNFRQIIDHLNKIPDRFNRAEAKEHGNGDPYTYQEIAETIALNACRFQTGYGEEFCSLAFVLLQEYPLQQAEAVYLRHLVFKSPGERTFILVSSPTKIDIQTPSTWGKDAQIIDPVSNETYSVQHILSHPENRPASWLAIEEQLQDTGLLLLCRMEMGTGHSDRWKKSKTRQAIKFWSASPADFAQTQQVKIPIPFVEQQISTTKNDIFPQTIGEICKHVVTRCNELLLISSNQKHPDPYKKLKVKLARKEKNWLTTQNLLLWDLNDPCLAERMKHDLDNTLVTINKNNNQETWNFKQILNQLDTIPDRFKINAIKKHKNGTPYTDQEMAESIALNACRVQAGNSEEGCSLVFVLLQQYPLHQIEPIYIRQITFKSPGDHTFILVSSRQKIKINDFSTWGEDAHIIDPLLNETFSVQHILNHPENRPASWIAIKKQLQDTGLSLVNRKEVATGHSERWKKSKTRQAIKFWSASPEDFAKNKQGKIPIPFVEPEIFSEKNDLKRKR